MGETVASSDRPGVRGANRRRGGLWMKVQHRSRLAAGTGVLAALLAVGVGAVVAPGAASAPVAASGPVAGSRGAGGSGSTAVAPPALTAPAGPAAGDPVLDPPYPHSATARAVAPM